jgi:hypothetical protein
MNDMKPTNLIAFLILLVLCYPGLLRAQSPDLSIGIWRHHLPSIRVVSLAEAPDRFYGATSYGIIEYNKSDNSIRKIDKVTGLSDFGITVIDYFQEKNILLIGYQNGNLDVIQNKDIFSIPDIRQANIFGSKRINNIFFSQNRAYLSCDFGIVVLDLNQFVILDTWFIGPSGSMLNVMDVTIAEDHFFAATEAGLLKASLNAPNLADYNYWQRESNLPFGKYQHVLVHNGVLIANYSGLQSDTLYSFGDGWQVFNPFGEEGYFSKKRSIRSTNNRLVITMPGRVDNFDLNFQFSDPIQIYAGVPADPLDAMIGSDGMVWIADTRAGLIKGRPESGYESLILSGPPTAESFRIAHTPGRLWVAPGSVVAGWRNTWNDRGIFIFESGNWFSHNRWRYPQINDVRDIHHVTPHIRNPDRVFASPWSGGLIEFDRNDGVVAYYDETNSTLQKRAGVNDIIRLGGSAWDSRGNLWISNSDADHFLSVLTHEGNWMSYSHTGYVTGNETLGPLIVDNFDQKWVSLPRGGGLIVFKEKSLTSNNDFDIRKLTSQQGSGSLPSTTVSALAKDKDGYIWVGTSAGVVVFYSPQQAFRDGKNGPIDAQTIILMQDEFAGRLFENETINSIFVDGSNKKWFGTRNSGAFLMSSDARETIMHFNKSNSPLPSNNILDISIEPQTGEIFFATDQGLVSFRGFSTQGQSQHTNVHAFPNPVRPGYNGYIAVRGLVTNARVKITDINGNLVHDTFAEGGQLVWNGRDLNGQRPSSGVYLVFSTDAQGNETIVSKILFMQ